MTGIRVSPVQLTEGDQLLQVVDHETATKLVAKHHTWVTDP